MSRASNASRSSRVESPKRFELGLAAVAFCVCGGLAVLFLLFGELEGASWKILTTAVVFGLYSLLALPGARLLDQGRSSILAWSAVLLAALGLLWAFRIVWSGLDDADGSWRLLVTLTACSTAVSQVCATTARRQATDCGAPVRFLGRVPDDDLPALYGCADVFDRHMAAPDVVQAAVVGLAHYFNRFTEALQVEPNRPGEGLDS